MVFFLPLPEPDLPDPELPEPVLDLPEEEVVFFFLPVVVLLPLNLILIPKYGYMAAALVTTLTEVINLILMRAYIRKIVKFNDIKEVIILLIPSIVMGLILSITRIFISNIFVLILISIVIYFITLFTLKIVTINELKEGFKD